jgi:hypothetical protein
MMKEMEELIIEANIKKEEGPLRSVWETAVERGRAQEDHTQNMSEPKGKRSIFWEDEVAEAMGGGGEGRGMSLPSPVSRSPTVGPVKLPSSTRHSHTTGARARRISC